MLFMLADINRNVARILSVLEEEDGEEGQQEDDA